MESRLRIGTRGSPLALWQANHVKALIAKHWPDQVVELVQIETTGDQIRDRPLAEIGGDGLFTKEIQRALQDRRIDIAVHSLKDLPTFPVAGLRLAAVPERGLQGDVFISYKHQCIQDLPQGSRIATSSLRRKAQLLNRRPDLQLEPIRGNVETRLRKMQELDLDGTILAQAGIERLGLGNLISEVLDPSWMLPAVGQGALGLECRDDDHTAQLVLAKLDNEPAHQCVLAERALLRGLGGGCQVPIGAMAIKSNNVLELKAAVLSPDGKARIASQKAAPPNRAEELGASLAQELLDLGASSLLEIKP